MEDGRGFILFSCNILSGLSVTFYSFSSRVSQFFRNFVRILCFSLDKGQSLYSYNTPDFSSRPIDPHARELGGRIESDERVDYFLEICK